MNTLKRKNMMDSYTGFKGAQTVNAVANQIPDELFEQLTGKQLGLLMNAVNTAYHNGTSYNQKEINDFLGFDFWSIDWDKIKPEDLPRRANQTTFPYVNSYGQTVNQTDKCCNKCGAVIGLDEKAHCDLCKVSKC